MNTGGPAFPLPDRYASDGMTLLDWYAGQALAAMVEAESKESHKQLSNDGYEHEATHFPRSFTDEDWWDGVAKASYACASAMLAEKARREDDHSPGATKMVPDHVAKLGLQAYYKHFFAALDHSPDAVKMAELEAANRELVEALDRLEVWGDELDANLSPPDRNCSCHISPPCSDCVDFAGQREAKHGWEDAKTKARAILAKHKRVA